MRLVHNRVFAALYWVVAFAATIFGAIVGAKRANEDAPEFGDGSGASASSHLLFGIGGVMLGALVVLAIFAGVWMALWAADRRSHPEVDDRDDYDTLADLDDDFDEAERDHLDDGPREGEGFYDDEDSYGDDDHGDNSHGRYDDEPNEDEQDEYRRYTPGAR